MMKYPKQLEMQARLDDLRSSLLSARSLPVMGVPRTGAELLAVERQAAAWGRKLADLLVAVQILMAHLLGPVLEMSMRAARTRHAVSGAPGRLQSVGWREVSLRLQFGTTLRLWTRYARPDRCGHRGPKRDSGNRRGAGGGGYPILEQLGIHHRVTPALREHVARQVVLCSSYAEARDNLARHGVDIPLTTLVPVSVGTGQQAIARRDAELSAARLRPLPRLSAVAGRRVQISLDGGRTKTRWRRRGGRMGVSGRYPSEYGWREPRVISVHLFDEDGQLCAESGTVYEVELADADEVFAQLTGLLRLLGVYQAAEVVFITDGASWIWRRLDQLVTDAEIPSEIVTYILDFYHATEHIHEALKACKTLSEAARRVEFRRLKGLLLEREDGVEAVVADLKGRARGGRAKAIKEEIAFLADHIEHMRYARFRSAGHPIGSGAVESAIRRIINLRFKSASMAWTEEHLKPLLYLRAILKAGHWERFVQANLRRRYWVDVTIFNSEPDDNIQKVAA